MVTGEGVATHERHLGEKVFEIRGNSGGIFWGWNLGFWRVWAGAEWREDSEAVNESFWDAPGVEIEAKQDLEAWRV